MNLVQKYCGVIDLGNEKLWDSFLDIIYKKTNPVSFNTWFNNISLLNITNNKISIKVPMDIHKKILSNNYYSLIEDTLMSLTGINYDIEFILEDEIKNENVDNLTVIDNKEEEKWESNLIESYTFDNFIVGDTNRFAKTAAIAVTEQPGKIYNPLFIYGKSGLGKTHLMHAIGNQIMKTSNKKVLYTTSDMFMNDFTGIAKSDDKNNLEYAYMFKEKYRNVDVLIIDDIQYLVGADKTQQEFFNTFNALHQANKQIIISSDRSPDDLKKLEERLRSRFTWGLPVDIYPPDFDLRCRILKNKIKNLDIANLIDEDVIEYIANSCDNDVRYLEGAITRLCAYAAMTIPKRIDMEFANEALKDYITKNIYSTGDIPSIQKAVCEYYNISVDEIKSKKRSNKIAYPRMVAMYLSRMLTDESFPRIGLEFGGRDHSTVIHACDKIETDLKTSSELKEAVNKIKNNISC